MTVPLPLPDPASATDAGRFILADCIEHRCQVLTVADGTVLLRAAVRVEVGERVVAYLDRFGRVTGRVSASTGDVFAVRTAGGRPAPRDAGGLPAARPGVTARAERIVPQQTRVLVRLATGQRLVAGIMDLSRSGVALTCPLAMEEGTPVTVGQRAARVVRRVHRLHGLVFDTPLAEAEFGPGTVL